MQFPLQIVFQLNVYDVNGNLIIQIGPDPAMFFYSPPTVLRMSISPFQGTDSFGNAYESGFVSYGGAIDKTISALNGAQLVFSSRPPALAYDTNGFLSITVNSDAAVNVRPTMELSAPEANSSPSGAGFLRLASGSSNGVLLPRVTIGNATLGNSAGSIVAVRATIVQENTVAGVSTQENWTNIPLAANWTAGSNTPQFYLDALGFVHLEGFVVYGLGVPADGTVMGTLPTKAIPRNDILTFLVFNNTNTMGRMVIRTTGNMEIYGAPNNLPVLDTHSYGSPQTV